MVLNIITVGKIDILCIPIVARGYSEEHTRSETRRGDTKHCKGSERLPDHHRK